MSVLTIEPGATPADEETPDTGERHRHEGSRLGGAGVTGVGSDEVRVGGRLNGGLL